MTESVKSVKLSTTFKLFAAVSTIIGILLMCGIVLLVIYLVPPAAPSYIHPSWPIFCSGSILHVIQKSHVFNDSKEFVDRPLKVSQEKAIEEFEALPNYARETLLKFIDDCFAEAGSDLDRVDPTDYQSEPPTLKAALERNKYYEWALGLNAIWRELVRKTVISDPARHTLLPSDNPIVVPGGRFRESFYWDSYWIIVGLIKCDMLDTAKGLASNFLASVRTYGFIPNGGRAYYLERSQPPLLAEMVSELYSANNDKFQQFIREEALPVLELEYDFWRSQRAVKVRDGLFLNLYTGGDVEYPRPESYLEDLETAADSEFPNEVLADLAAGAESGWDYSSRWVGRQDGRLNEIDTRNIVPVDLNVMLLRYEKHLQRLFGEFEDPEKSATYGQYARLRENSIEELMWNETDGMWRDWMLRENKSSEVVALSNFLPLWAGLGLDRKPQVLEALRASGLVRAGGVATTTVDTGEQWDGDNAWPPLQDLIVEGLLNGGDAEGRQMAVDIVKKWLASNFKAWQDHGAMREKYLASKPGQAGGGGEYEVQDGFGWTNGVALKMMVEFSEEL